MTTLGIWLMVIGSGIMGIVFGMLFSSGALYLRVQALHHRFREYRDMMEGQEIAYRSAVEQYLSKTGHDLCHSNRRELAQAFSLHYTKYVADPPKDRNEFRQRCQEYEEQLYGVET